MTPKALAVSALLATSGAIVVAIVMFSSDRPTTRQPLHVRTAAELAAAVDSAPPGATIELAWNDSLPSNRLSMRKPLRLRAAAGFRPALESSGEVLIDATAPLALEGLTLYLPPATLGRETPAAAGIIARRGVLALSHCRIARSFRRGNAGAGIVVAEDSTARLERCELYGAMTLLEIRGATPGPTPKLTLLSCILAGERAIAIRAQSEPAGAKLPVRLELHRSTFRESLSVIDIAPGTAATVSVVANSCVFDSDVLVVDPRSRPENLRGGRASLLQWRDRGSVFANRLFLRPRPMRKPRWRGRDPTHVEAWRGVMAEAAGSLFADVSYALEVLGEKTDLTALLPEHSALTAVQRDGAEAWEPPEFLRSVGAATAGVGPRAYDTWRPGSASERESWEASTSPFVR